MNGWWVARSHGQLGQGPNDAQQMIDEVGLVVTNEWVMQHQHSFEHEDLLDRMFVTLVGSHPKQIVLGDPAMKTNPAQANQARQETQSIWHTHCMLHIGNLARN